jgi:hypothetical protein
MVRRLLLSACALSLFACPPPVTCDPEVEDCTDGGDNLPPDSCNTRDEALSNADCALTSGVAKEAHISLAGDQDWFLATMPANAGPRTLLHVTAGYSAPATPVNLALTIFREDGKTALTRKIDKHDAKPPAPIDVVLPFGEANARLLLQLSEEGATTTPKFDVRNAYTVKFETMDNPDANEPNETAANATNIPLMGTVPTGQVRGALATDDDVDVFAIDNTAARKVLYLRISAPQLMPAPSNGKLLVSYTLKNPSGTPISEGRVTNAFLAVNLATARLVTQGKYTLEIRGYKEPGSNVAIPGDLRLQYTVDVQLFDDLDTNEPNNIPGTATQVGLAIGASTTMTGRIGFVPDPDIYALNLAATSNHGVLRYRFVPGTGAGRFPPLAPIPDRQLRVVSQVTQGATTQDRRLACKTNSNVCPKGYEGSIQFQSLVESLCDSADPPYCLLAERIEAPSTFASLNNMQGAIPIPPHNALQQLFFFVQDEGTDWADDRDYQLQLSYELDMDETTRASLPAQTQATTVSESASFPTPSSAGQVSGVLSFGYGRVLQNDIDQGQGVRGPEDYDATPTDQDRYQLNWTPFTTPADRIWALEWDIDHVDGGAQAPADLALDMQFCISGTPLPDGGGCMGINRVLAFAPDRIAPWYSNSFTDRNILWTRSVTPGVRTTVRAEPIGCFCIEPRTGAVGTTYMRVGAVDRQQNVPVNYRIRQSFTSYPQGFTVDGGAATCPAVPPDGGAGAP